MTPQEVFQLPVRPSLQRITQSIAQLQATRVLELGTSVGVSTRLISQALQVTKGHLWSIDINPPIDNWHLAWDCSNIAFLQHDALTYPWKQEVDLLFIDDKHSYRHRIVSGDDRSRSRGRVRGLRRLPARPTATAG